MISKKKEKGFALVMSLVLLMVMSLMGGALIVISASDHRSNNISDEYQQTFYVAETALFEGEKYLINQFLGPYQSNGGGKRDTSKRGLPGVSASVYTPNPTMEDCYYSFPDIDIEFFKLASGPNPATPSSATKQDIFYSKDFYSLLAGTSDAGKTIIEDPIKNDADTNINTSKFLTNEKTRLKKFKFQYFIHRIGAAPFKGYGDSIKKGASDAGNDGMAYRIYGCGNFDNGTIIVPLESTMVLPK